MMRTGKKRFFTVMLVVLGWFGSQAQAEFLVQVTATLNGSSANSAPSTSGLSTTTLSVFASSPSDIDLGGTTHPVHQTFGVTSTTSSTTVGTDPINITYQWTLTLSHIVNGVAVGNVGTLAVSGQILGNLSAFGSSLSNTFLSGPIATPTMVRVDGVSVAVQLDDWTPPGTPPNTQRNFSVSLIDPVDPPIFPVPEPSTIVLISLGGLILLSPKLRCLKKSNS